MQRMQSERIRALDIIKGIAIIGVVIVHTLFDIPLFFENNSFTRLIKDILMSQGFQAISYFGAGLFIFICGLCMSFSHSNRLRAVKLILIAYTITLVTFLFMPEETIWFGVLHCLGVCIFITSCFSGCFAHMKNLRVSSSILILLFCLAMVVLSQWLIEYCNPVDVAFLYPLGFYEKTFASGDYYPLLPWLFVFLAGCVCGPAVKERKLPSFFYKVKCAPLEWCGRRCLWIYLLQQPIVVGLFLVMTKLHIGA